MTESMEVQRVTAPLPTFRTKDPQKQAAGRAGAAARKVKQERLLEELRDAKERITPAASAVTSDKQQPMPAHANPGDPLKSDWAPWILVGAGLAALCVWRASLVKPTVSGARQQKQLHPEARSSGASQPPPTPRCAQQLKVPDPFHME